MGHCQIITKVITKQIEITPNPLGWPIPNILKEKGVSFECIKGANTKHITSVNMKHKLKRQITNKSMEPIPIILRKCIHV